MEITPDIQKRLQVVGKALSEVDFPLKIGEKGPCWSDEDTCVVVDSYISWAEDEIQEWVGITARRDHEYAHLRYTSRMVWEYFVRWALKQEEEYQKDPRKGYPSAEFAIDVFNAIEDARVERAWTLEYPGAAARIGYHNLKSAANMPAMAGLKAVVMSLYFVALLGDIPTNLVLTAEEVRLVKRTRPLVEIGRRASNTREARDYVHKILKAFRNYLTATRGGYQQLLPNPRGAKTPVEVPHASKEPLSRSEEITYDRTGEEDNEAGRNGAENAPGREEKGEQAGRDKDGVQLPANGEEKNNAAGNKSASAVHFPVSYDEGFGEKEGESIDDENACEDINNNPESRNRAFSTPGPESRSKIDEKGDREDSGRLSRIEGEEEYQQLLAGAEKKLKNASHREDRARWIIKRKSEAQILEQGIHRYISSHELQPREPEAYFDGDFEQLTPVDMIRQTYRKQIVDLSRQIKEMLLHKKILPERRLRKGWPDSSNLWRLSMGEANVFRKRLIESSKPDVSVLLLVDSSRSMRRNRRSELCKQSLVVAAESLNNNQVKFAIKGFTTGNEYNTVVNIDFKPFGEGDLHNLDYYSGFNENRDGYSIRKAALELERRMEQKKLLLVLSDSVPNHTHVNHPEMNYSYEMGKGIRDTILAIRETMRKGIIVVGIFFGSGSEVDRIRPVYPNFVHCEVSNLPRVLVSVLGRCLR